MTVEAEAGGERTLAWLEGAVEQAREEGWEKLGELLEAVRDELVFEEEISCVPRQVWRIVARPSAGTKGAAGWNVPGEVLGRGRGKISGRQVEVLLLASRGLSNRQIAVALGLAEATVKRHLSNIYGRLNVRCRSEAVRKGLAEGWISVSGIVGEDGGHRVPPLARRRIPQKKPLVSGLPEPGGRALKSA